MADKTIPKEQYLQPIEISNDAFYRESFLTGFHHLQMEIHENAVAHGFWDKPRNDGEMIALMHSELSEMLEGLRHDNPPSEHIPSFSAAEEELADLFIRAMDMAQARGYRIDYAMLAKHEFNKNRERKHGKEF